LHGTLDLWLGGEHNGQRWKDAYGWNFTIFNGEIEQIAYRTTFIAAPGPCFGNAYLLTGNSSHMSVFLRQM
jgi:hypothetical protein